ncbi:MAG: hypothetical protein WAT71_04225 [Ignavibacteria bacterium]
MKIKIIFSFVLFLSVILFLFTKPFAQNNSSTPPSPDNQFLITAMACGGVDTNYTNIPDLGLNAWHTYTGPEGGWPGISNDRYDSATSAYSGAVIQRINDNKNHGMRSVMDRPKIEYLAFGQKSEYQCEGVSKVDPNFWYYTYDTNEVGQNFQDNTQFGNNQWVRFCDADSNNPGSVQGYVVKSLKANREQANRYWPSWIADSSYAWYVMPKIRIPTGISDNTPVCRVEVLDWNGTIIKNLDLIAKNFMKGQVVQYDGRYREDYFFGTTFDSSAIDIPIGAICAGDRRDFTEWWSVPVKTDFRVYWYGQCDMWIDYVKVENEPAHQLFSGIWDQQIREETDIALSNYDPSNPIPNNFYIEEFEFNIVDAMKYVNTIIKERSNFKLSLMVNLNYPLFKVHIPYNQNEFSASQINEYLVNKAGIKYLVNMSYPLEGFEGPLYPVNEEGTSAHPVTLLSSDYSASTGVLSYVKPVSEYENWLQAKLDEGKGSGDGFMKIMKKTDSLSRYYSQDLKLVHLAQAHSWWARGHKLKEPSNEELELMANLSIGYGAKGIMYFAYNSLNYNFDTTNGERYERGLTEIDGSPRDSNVYGQDKWNAVKKINSTLSKWGTTILKFNQIERRSYAYHLSNERSAMNSNGQFINEIFTYKPGIDGNALTTSDPLNERYIQATFFDKYYYLNLQPHPKSKYFMIINRRCSPFIDNSSTDNIGGKRNIKVNLSQSLLGFTKFRNVSLIDIGNDSILTTFYNDANVNNNPTIDLGWFNPGEGKIFRLSPALCVGGTLVADELDLFNESFICEGNVFTNGKDVLLEDSINIEFTSTGKFIVNGGTFGCISSSPTINLKGLNGQLWSGFSFTNCTFAFQNVKFENTTGYPITILNSNANITDCEFNSNSSAILMDQTTNVNGTNFYLINSKFNLGNTTSPLLSKTFLKRQ